MSNTSHEQGADRATRLARGAKVSGNSGKLCSPDTHSGQFPSSEGHKHPDTWSVII
jgi:hypothetical protein